MKKLLSLLLASLLLCTLLSACTGGEGDGGDAGGDPQTTGGDTGPASGEGSGAQAVDTETVAVGAVIIARDDVPEEDIYTFVSTIFENADSITQQHNKGAELDLDFAASVASVPYHPGAARYFEEKGMTVASVKEGAGEGDSKALTLGTGSNTGTYYGYGGVLTSYVSNNTDLRVSAVTSDGSKANIEDVDAGMTQLGFVQSDVMSYAYNGERLFDTAVGSFSVVAALYMEQVQIVTTNPDIQSVADLAGRTVSIGASGSGVYFNAIDVLGAYGLGEEDITAVFQNFDDSADSLKDGKIDAAFIVAGAPTTAISELATSGSVYLVSLDSGHIEGLLSDSPYYSAYTIPADTYQ